jgi:Na+/melibiose symporter-like transporter
VVGERRFTVFWLGQTLSGFGDAFALVAVPLLVLESTGSIAGMGLVSASGVLAQVLTSLVSGNVIDRLDRRRTMIVCDLGRALGYGLLPALAWSGHAPLWLIYLTVIVGGALANLFAVGYMTCIPALVRQDRLHAANARMQGSLALAYVLGSLSAGLVASSLGPTAALTVDAATFLVSALSLFIIRLDAPRQDAGRAHQRFGAGLRFLLGHRLLRAMTLVLVLVGICGNVGVGAGITDLMIFHVKSELALGSFRVGLCIAVTALGALAGAAVAPALSKRLGSGHCFLLGNFVQAIGLVVIGALPLFAAAAGGGLLWGAGMMMRGVPMHSLRQQLIPSGLLGRVTAISWTAVFSASALGTALITRIAAHTHAGKTMLGIGIAVAAIGSTAWLGPIRRDGGRASGTRA